MSKKANEQDDCLPEEGAISVIEGYPDKKIIYIIGEINDETANETITALLNTKWEEGVKEIHLYITSQGGFLSDCFAIIDLIMHIREKYGVTIYTYGLGEIASAGFFIFIVGDIRVLFPSCRVFVHTHITINGAQETYQDRIKADKTEEKEVYENYMKYTAKQLVISIAKSKNLLKKSKWLSRKEIKDYNIGKEVDNETR